MNISKDKLLTFKKNDIEYIFSGYTGLISHSNPELQKAIKEQTITDEETIKYLFGDINKNTKNRKKRIPQLNETNLQNITIFATNKCNLTCLYCYERENDALNSIDMSIDTFKEGIQYFISKFYIGSRPINILFFGGEPMMNIQFLRDAVFYLNKIKKDKSINFIFSITTNGTIMPQSTLDFLLEYDFNLVVSIDGFKETHDHYRPFLNGKGSYEKIIENVKYISQYKKVVARVTLNDFSTNIVKLYEKLREFGFSIVHVTIVSKESISPDNIEEAFKPLLQGIMDMENYFLKNIKEKRIVQYNDIIKYLKIIHLGFRTSGGAKIFPCSAGYSSFSMATNGDIYLCHRFNNVKEMKLGNTKDGIRLDLRSQFLNEHHISERDDSCKTCWASAFCGGTCYHPTFSATGGTKPIHGLHCKYTKEMVKSALNIYVSMTLDQKRFLDNMKNERAFF